jgi:hypothetical protein
MYALCLDNKDYEASLELRKLYLIAQPEANDPDSYLRVVDESGEDYLYPANAFEILSLPDSIEQKLTATL